jgi:hypothetical protein
MLKMPYLTPSGNRVRSQRMRPLVCSGFAE